MTTISNNYSNIYMQSRPMHQPKVDTNQDQSFDLEELESFSKKVSEKQGTSFDAQEIMTKYDSNEDGLISKTESSSLKEDNAFNLETPQGAQMKMMSSRPPRPPQGQGKGEMGITTSNDLTTALLEAFESEDDTDSTDDLTSELLDALESSSTSNFSASEIAEYDTNGDGEIDSVEEALMNNTSDESITDTLFEKALTAYQNQSSYVTSISELNNFNI